MEEQDYPTLSDRAKSLLVDQVFIVTLMFVFTAVLDRFQHPPNWIRVVLFLGIWGIYEPFCMHYACTIGNYVMGIRIRRYKDTTKRMGLAQAYFRYFIKLLLGWLSVLSVATNKEKRAIHDLAADSMVVKYAG